MKAECVSRDGDVWCQLNPSTPMSDQDRISPYNINTKSRRQEMRTKKSINKGVISWSNTKFSEVTLEDLYSRQSGDVLMTSWELKG